MTNTEEYKYAFTAGTSTVHINPIHVITAFIYTSSPINAVNETNSQIIIQTIKESLRYETSKTNMQSYLNLIARLNQL